MGATNTVTKPITINPLPIALFSVETPTCLDNPVQFRNHSTTPTGYIVEWYWDFGDGNSTTITYPDNPDVTHTYASPGISYPVTLTIKNSDSCSNSVTNTVITTSSPIAMFTHSSSCYGVPVTFTDTSEENGGGEIISWSWDFGDPTSGVNNTSNLQNPVHLYTSAGTYYVELIIENASGCTDTIPNQEVIVTEGLVVEIQTDNDTVCLDTPINFTSVATAAVLWSWDFGDGGTSTTQHPTHTYTSTGNFTVTLTAETADGCQGYAEYDIVVNESPIAAFSTDSPACLGAEIDFYNESTSPTGYITEWVWDFGDGSTAVTVLWPDNPDVSHVYTLEGTYEATLTVTNSNGCIDSISHEVSVAPAPVAAFDYNGTCAESPVSFIDLSQENGGGAITDWSWDFGDPASGTNNTSTLQNPTHIFTAPNTYIVQLIIENENGCTDTIINPDVIVTEALAVDIQIDNDTICFETPIDFEGVTTNAVIWLWEFGDGNTSNVQNPTHTYTEIGNYVVTLYAEAVDGCSNTADTVIVVKPNPISIFTSTSPGCLADSVYFTNQSITPNGYIATWIWDFGDGNTVTIDTPNDPDVAHKYDFSGTFEVFLTVIDDAGCENISSRLIQVSESPIAEFSFEETCYNSPVYFTDLSLTNGGSDIFSWEWFFGDSNSGIENHSTLQNPTHIFTEPDSTYITTLIVVNTLGCTDTVEYEITVDSLPYVDFTMADDSICLGESAEFTGITSTGTGISTWSWDFGDGGLSIEQNPSYTYGTSGTYIVTLTVTEIGPDECQNSISYPIYVNDAPEANFTYENTCQGDSTYFTDLSYSQNGFISGWEWNFGDGNTSTEEDPIHYYQDNDEYMVTLISMDNYGCSDTIVQWIQVFGKPVSGFVFDQSCEPVGLVNFFDESLEGEDGSPIQSWEWDFGDGNSSSEINPEYIYANTDSCYQVSLTITDANGCIDIDTIDVCLFGTLEVEFTSTEECLGVPTVFTASYSPDNDSIESYTWNFNDGSQNESTYHNTISHEFPHPGLFIVELIALDTNGCTATTYGEVVVDSLPTPRFTNTIGFCDTPTQFTDESLNGGSFIESWYWDFGDITSGAANTSTDQHPTHLYGPYDSTYQVKLIITNFNGCTDSIVQEVYVEPCLVADFELPTGLTCARYELCFNDISMLSSNSGEITQWRWDFGDGTPTYNYNTQQNPICHTYEDGGNYDVQLIVVAMIRGIEYQDTIIKAFTVNATPIAGMQVSANCLGDSTRFYDDTDTNFEPITQWHWHFGDDSNPDDTAIIQNPAYLYPDYDTYFTELKVMNQFGCRDSITTPVEIFKPPEAEFIFEETCMSYYTYFTDESVADSSDIVSYLWNFGDTLTIGDTSNLQNTEYIYDSVGYYDVHFTITDGNQCFDTISHTVEIYPIPTSNFIIMDTMQQGQIYLDNISIGSTSYYWDFEYDYGVSSTEENPTHQYEEDGNYDIMLVSYNEYGCPDTTYQVYELLFTNLFVPNAFVPNNSNPELKEFKPIGINLRSYQIEVYSAWGNLVFQSTQLENGAPAEGWDGTFENKDLPTGSYIWRISAVFEDGEHWKGSDNGDGNTSTNGTVTLIR